MSDATTGKLVFAEPESVKSELNFAVSNDIKADPEVDSELQKEAAKWADKLVSIDPQEAQAADSGKAAIENMGLALQESLSQRSQMLQAPIKTISDKSDDGGPVARSLIDLKLQVEALDPGDFDFEAGWFSRLVGQIPGIGTPIKRYFTKFESSQTIIDAIIRSLTDGKEQLKRDNRTLQQDQQFMRELSRKLEKAIKLGQLIDEQLEYRLSRELTHDAERSKFVQEELLFPLRQRIMDLQQQLAVCQQGVLTLEVVIRNNKELVRGVNRATHVTVNALQIAVTLALALANQKIVLDKVQAVNETTSNLISGTASRLKTQGVEIHKQAASTQIDMSALQSAFRDINTALDDISNFRAQALPKMAQTISEMHQLTEEGATRIKKLEQGGVAAKDVFEIIPDDENW